jgi:hypothetical protein
VDAEANMAQTEPQGPAEDYSYDLAHEDVERSPATPHPPEPVQVSTDTPSEADGDYSYDLAHEVPPA